MMIMNGYTKVPNNFFKWLYDKNLTGLEFKIVLFIFQKTIGWGKLSDKISLSQFETELKATRRGVTKALKQLGNSGTLVRTKGFITSYKLGNASTLLLGNQKVTTRELEGIEIGNHSSHTKERKNIYKRNIKISNEGLQLDPSTGLVTKA